LVQGEINQKNQKRYVKKTKKPIQLKAKSVLSKLMY